MKISMHKIYEESYIMSSLVILAAFYWIMPDIFDYFIKDWNKADPIGGGLIAYSIVILIPTMLVPLYFSIRSIVKKIVNIEISPNKLISVLNLLIVIAWYVSVYLRLK